MPKRRRRTKIPAPAWERPRGTLGRQLFGRSPRFYGTLGIIALVAVALGLVGFAYWSDYQAKQHRPDSTAVRVGDAKYTLRHYTARLSMLVQQLGGPGNNSAQPSVAIPATSQVLIQESVIIQFAGDEGITATDDEIKQELAVRLGLAANDASFDTRFQEELTRSGLKEDQYRRMVQAAVLSAKLESKLGEGVPASAESVHLRQITVSDEARANDLKSQVEGGADFAQLAAQNTLDTGTKDKGGDAGWVARGVMDKADEDAVFALAPGAMVVVPRASGAVVLYQVLEKAADRAIEANQKTRLSRKALQDWVDKKKQGLNVKDLVSQDRAKQKWAVSRAYTAT
ncbi:MAG TPA: SurA N-terminal domain-containing protein [Dehalococcoidia bacterium]|nr:SurA N-terminal domain-containing protein [Dehalococcoidia bacterium]